MKFVKQNITDYTSVNIIPEFDTWDIATSYAVGTQVIWKNYIWISSTNTNTGNEPTDSSTVWSKYGVSNFYSLIDLQSRSNTIVEDDDLIVEFSNRQINTLVFGYISCETLRIENLDALGNVLYTQEKTISKNGGVVDWYTYIYEPFTNSTLFNSYFKVPRFGTKIRVSFLKGSLSGVECGFLVGGLSIDMGRTKENVKLGWTSYSLISTNDFGITTIIQRAAQDYYDFETSIDTSLLTNTLRQAKLYKDSIVAFIIDDEPTSQFENIVALGIMQETEPIASNFDKTTLTWTIIETI